MKRLLALLLLLPCLALGQVVTNPSGTGVNPGTIASFPATTSAELRGVVSDETGTGSLVFSNTPTLTTPVLGAATFSSLTNNGSASLALKLTAPTASSANGAAQYLQWFQTDGSTSKGYVGFLSNDDDQLWLSSAGPSKVNAGTVTTINGATGVNLQYNGSTKAATTSAGVSITGTLAASGNITSNSGSVPYVLCQSAVAVSAPADTNEDVLYTCTVPAGAMGANGSLRVAFAASLTNNANAKTLRVRLGGASGTIYFQGNTASMAGWNGQIAISNRNAANSQVGANAGSSVGGLGNSAIVTSAVDTTLATTLLITCQKATAVDTCTLERVLVELLYGA